MTVIGTKSIASMTSKKQRLIALWISAKRFLDHSWSLIDLIFGPDSSDGLNHLAIEYGGLSELRLRLHYRNIALYAKSVLHFYSFPRLIVCPWVFDTLKAKWRAKVFFCDLVAIKSLAPFELLPPWQLHLTIKIQTALKVVLYYIHGDHSTTVSFSGFSRLSSGLWSRILNESWLGLWSHVFLPVALFVAQDLIHYCLGKISEDKEAVQTGKLSGLS